MSRYKQIAIVSGTAIVAISLYVLWRRNKHVNNPKIIDEQNANIIKDELKSCDNNSSLNENHFQEILEDKTEVTISEKLGPERHENESLVEWIDRQLREAEERKRCKEIKQQTAS